MVPSSPLLSTSSMTASPTINIACRGKPTLDFWMICYSSHQHIPNGLAMEYNPLVGLATFYPLLNSHFPKHFNPLSTVYYDTSALFSVDHCLLQASRRYPNSKIAPFPGVLNSMLNPAFWESAPKSVTLPYLVLWSSFLGQAPSKFSHTSTYSFSSYWYMLANSCSSFEV